MIATSIIPVSAGEFEGPLDLLLELTRRHQLSLESLPVAEITGPYLDYLKEAQRANINLGADFIYMAATLIQIKSRQLLPQDPALRRNEGSGGGDPAEALLARLREHQRSKAAAEMLKTKLEVEETTWSRPSQAREFWSPGGAMIEDPLTAQPRQATLADLIDTLGDALRRVRTHTAMAVENDPVTVEDRIAWLSQRLPAKPRTLSMAELFDEQPTRVARCCLFLGLLEMGRDGHLAIEQTEPFGEVLVGPR